MRSGFWAQCLWVVVLAVVLSPPPEPRTAPAALSEVPVTPGGPLEPAFISLVRPAVPEGRRGAETAGQATLFLELFLGDLTAVVPMVEGMPEHPGFSLSLPDTAPPWTATPVVGLLPDERFSLTVTLCDPGGVCSEHRAEAERLHPNAAAGDVVAGMAERLARPLPFEKSVWTAPITKDDYLVLFMGRAAAALYGLAPPVAPELVGDIKRDPIARASFLDARVAASWVMAARGAPSPSAAMSAWKYAADRAPQSAGIKAARAASLDATGSPELAWAAWQAVASLAPADLRFLVPRARAALRVGDTKEAERVLALIPERFDRDPLVAMMAVAVADAHGGADDALIAAWQDADSVNPEPVRRRITTRLQDGRYEEALVLTGELRRRGAEAEADAQAMALAADLGRYADAADAARRLGDLDAARRLAARAAPDDATRLAALEGAQDPMARLARGRLLVKAGRAADARVEADALLKLDPWWPDALALRADALAGLGQAAAAAEVRQRLLQADPLYGEGVR